MPRTSSACVILHVREQPALGAKGQGRPNPVRHKIQCPSIRPQPRPSALIQGDTKALLAIAVPRDKPADMLGKHPERMTFVQSESMDWPSMILS